jgi:two-component system, NarL family, nitrate/nitrite response regulator NarL
MPPQPSRTAFCSPPIPGIGVLVIDDEPAVREGLARLVACAPLTLRFISTAANSLQALSAAARLKPDLVLLDVDLGGEDGLALVARLRVAARVVVLTSHGDAATRKRAASLGALALVEKDRPAAELLRVIVDIALLHSREEAAPSANVMFSHL